MTAETLAALEGVDVAKGAENVKRILGMVVNVSADVPKDAVILAGAPSTAAPNATPSHTVVTVNVPALPRVCGKPCSRWIRREGINGLICDDCGAKKRKATRKDAGIPRPKPTAAAPASGGTLTIDQVEKLSELSRAMVSAAHNAHEARNAARRAELDEEDTETAHRLYLRSLVASPGVK